MELNLREISIREQLRRFKSTMSPHCQVPNTHHSWGSLRTGAALHVKSDQNAWNRNLSKKILERYNYNPFSSYFSKDLRHNRLRLDSTTVSNPSWVVMSLVKAASVLTETHLLVSNVLRAISKFMVCTSQKWSVQFSATSKVGYPRILLLWSGMLQSRMSVLSFNTFTSLAHIHRE